MPIPNGWDTAGKRHHKKHGIIRPGKSKRFVHNGGVSSKGRSTRGRVQNGAACGGTTNEFGECHNISPS